MTAIDAFYWQIKQEFGNIDVLFLNADAGKLLPFDLISEDILDETIHVNSVEVFFGLQKALPYLHQLGRNSLFNQVTGSKGLISSVNFFDLLLAKVLQSMQKKGSTD